MTTQLDYKWLLLLPPFIKNRIEGSHNLQLILSNTGWLFFEKFLRMGVGLFVGAWIARYLGPEQFGLLNYATAFVAMFSALATLGLEGIIVRDIVREPSKKARILGTAFSLKFIGSVVTLLITLLVLILLRPQDRLMHWLVAIISAGTVFQAFDTIDIWFQAQVQSKYSVHVRNGAFLLISIAKIGLILMHAPLIAFAWAWLAEIIIGSIGLVVAYRMNGQFLKEWVADIALAKSLLKGSWPLIFSGTFVLINVSIDKVMLGDLVSNSGVGLYSAASSLSGLCYFIPVVVGASVMPALVRAKEVSDQHYYAKLQQTYNFMTIFALSIALPMTFLSQRLIAVLYGPEYASAAHMLSIHIWTGLFVFHVSIRTRSFIIEGKEKFIALISFFTMISNVIFNLYLIPAYGGVGASYASLFSWIICALIAPYLSRQTSESVKMFFKSFYLWLPARRQLYGQ